MNKYVLTLFAVFSSLLTTNLNAHCQMPCGIYHDQMIYDKIDEFYETMIKANSVLNANKFETVEDKNQLVRWVITKEESCDEIAGVLTKYFLQQKIKPSNDEDTAKLLQSVHRMLFALVQIKQTAEVKIVRGFGDEWANFKDLFHPEDKCREATPPKIYKTKAT